jgi:hypothetical protein
VLISRRFGIHEATVRDVLSGRTWSYVESRELIRVERARLCTPGLVGFDSDRRLVLVSEAVQERLPSALRAVLDKLPQPWRRIASLVAFDSAQLEEAAAESDMDSATLDRGLPILRKFLRLHLYAS